VVNYGAPPTDAAAIDKIKAPILGNFGGDDMGIKPASVRAFEAAAKGAEATRQMKAKFGRARNLGDRVLGHPDPGAVSVSLIFKGFSEGL
jgi:dienelactone hydrolase